MNTLAKFVLPQPKFAVTPDHTKSEHWYSVSGPDGGRFFSVTGYKGQHGGSKVDRIKGWSLKMAGLRARALFASEDMTANPKRAYEASIEVKRAAKQALDLTAFFGVLLHDFAEKKALNVIDSKANKAPLLKDYDEEIKPCIRLFNDWWNNRNFTPIAAELMVASKRLKAAGTMDLLAVNNETGKIEIIDYKTSGDLHVDVQGQLGGLNIALEETYGFKADTLRGVRFGREDTIMDDKVAPDNKAAEGYFEACVDIKRKFDSLGAW